MANLSSHEPLNRLKPTMAVGLEGAGGYSSVGIVIGPPW